MSMENSNDTTGNRSRDLATCSAVPPVTEYTSVKLPTDGRQAGTWTEVVTKTHKSCTANLTAQSHMAGPDERRP